MGCKIQLSPERSWGNLKSNGGDGVNVREIGVTIPTRHRIGKKGGSGYKGISNSALGGGSSKVSLGTLCLALLNSL